MSMELIGRSVEDRVLAATEESACAGNPYRLFEHSREGLVVLDRDRRFFYINREAARILQTDRETLQNRSLLQLLNDSPDSPLWRTVGSALEAECRQDFRILHPPCQKWLTIRMEPDGERWAVFLLETTADLRISDVVESIPEAFVLLDRAGNYLYVNREAARLVGLQPEQMIGRNGWELYPKSTVGIIYEAIQTVLDEKRPVHIETTSPTRGHPIELAIYPYGDDAAIFIRDIAERRQTEQSLARRVQEQSALYTLTDRLQRARCMKEIYEAALDALQDGLDIRRASILLFDEAGVMRFVGWRGLSDGYRRAVEGHSPWQPGETDPHPISLSDIEEADLDDSLRQHIRSEGIRALAFIPLLSNGTLVGKFMLYCNEPHDFQEAELELALAIGRQLAFGIERKRAEKALRQSEQQLKDIFSQNTAGIAQVDLNSRFLLINQRFCEITGYTAEELRERTCAEITHPEDLACDLALFETALKDQNPYVIEKRYLRPDNSIVWVRNSVSAIQDADGRQQSMLAVSIDITEQKQAEKAVAERVQEIEHLNERLRRSIRETHHRVKNNLQIISAMLDMQAMQYSDQVPVQELERLRQHVQALASIHDLLTQQAKSDSHAYTLSARAALHRLMPMLQAMSQGRVIEYRSENVLLPIRHAITLTVLVNELVSNAVKHGQGRIHVCFTQQEEQAILEVSDEGPGFPPDFSPMQAAHSGLELIESLSRYDLSGQVNYENVTEGGGRVRVLFPLIDPQPTPGEQ